MADSNPQGSNDLILSEDWYNMTGSTSLPLSGLETLRIEIVDIVTPGKWKGMDIANFRMAALRSAGPAAPAVLHPVVNTPNRLSYTPEGN